MCEQNAMCLEGSGVGATSAGAAGRLCACALQCYCSFAVRLLPPRRDQRTRGAMQTYSSAETEIASYKRRCVMDVETAQITRMNWNAVKVVNLHKSNLDLTSNSNSLLQLCRLQAMPATALVPVFKATRCLLGSGTNMQRHRQLSRRRG